MGIDTHVNPSGSEDYSELYRKINGRPFANDTAYLNNTGPIVNVICNLQGVKISGKGIGEEVGDQVDTFSEQIARDQAAAAQKQ